MPRHCHSLQNRTSALAALAFSVSNRESPEPATCLQRLELMGKVVWDPQGPILHPGDQQTVVLEFDLTPTGEVQNIRATGTPSKYDDIAVSALQRARFAADENNPDNMGCSYPLTLRLE